MSSSKIMTAIISFSIGFGIGVGIAKNVPIVNYAAILTAAAAMYGIIGLYAYSREMSLAIAEEEERDKVKKSE